MPIIEWPLSSLRRCCSAPRSRWVTVCHVSPSSALESSPSVCKERVKLFCLSLLPSSYRWLRCATSLLLATRAAARPSQSEGPLSAVCRLANRLRCCARLLAEGLADLEHDEEEDAVHEHHQQHDADVPPPASRPFMSN